MGSSSSSFDDYSYSPAAAACRETTMCMEIGGGRGRRGDGGARAADGGKTTKQKQPQRGLGVAQLEKIRLHNQMLAAYRSATTAAQHQLHDDAATTTAMMHQLMPPPPAAAVAPGGGSSFQPYHHHVTNRCFEETTDHHHRQGAVHYYDGVVPYSRTATATPSLYAHDVRDSSGHRLGQPPQQHYWPMMSSRSDGASAEELDLELRL